MENTTFKIKSDKEDIEDVIINATEIAIGDSEKTHLKEIGLTFFYLVDNTGEYLIGNETLLYGANYQFVYTNDPVIVYSSL